MDAEPVNEVLDWEQPNHDGSNEERYQNTAEQCEILRAKLDKTIIERDALAAATVEAKAESDWWHTYGAYEEEEERPIESDCQQQLTYKDRLLIDLNKRVDEGMTTLREVKERSRVEKEDLTAEIAQLKEKLDTAISDLELISRGKRSLSKGYQVTLKMLKGKLRQDDIIDAISYYYNIVSSDNVALAEKVEFQAADLERSREEVARKDLQYRDLSRTSAKQLLAISEVEKAKRSLEVEVGRLEAEEAIGAQERKEEIEQYERQLEQANAQNAALGEKIRTILRLGANERTESELDGKDQEIERLENDLWHAEQRIEDLLERSKRDQEAGASDATFAALQDIEYELYKRRLFSAEAEVVALKVELADQDKMLDGSNPLRLKEASVYREALDIEKLDRREKEEKLAEELALTRQQPEAKIEALEAMGNLLWARSRNLKATLDVHGQIIVEENDESEGIDAACRTLFGVDDDGSEDDPEGGPEDGPGTGEGDEPDDEAGGAGLSEDGTGEQEPVEDDAEDITIRPRGWSIGAQNVSVEDGGSSHETYPREAGESSW